MKYYLLKKGDKEEDALELGEESFDVFYDYGGLAVLHTMMDVDGNYDVLTNGYDIHTSTGKAMEINEFLDLLNTLQVRIK